MADAARALQRQTTAKLAPEPRLRRTIGLGSAVALYAGAVLGTGILVLPAVAAETAGPASIIAWTGLSLLSLPLALTFAALGRRQPVAGGFTAYIVRAFGRRWGAIAGWLFLAQVPTGSAFVGFLAASYLAAPFGLGRDAHFAIALTFIALAYGVNLMGLRLVGAVQTVATVGVLALVIGVVLAANRDVRAEAFVPFAPLGFSAVGVAAVQIFWAFVGWEAITPLAEEFRSPERDLRRASVISVGVVAVIYLALALVTIGTHAYGAEAGGLPRSRSWPSARSAGTPCSWSESAAASWRSRHSTRTSPGRAGWRTRSRDRAICRAGRERYIRDRRSRITLSSDWASRAFWPRRSPTRAVSEASTFFLFRRPRSSRPTSCRWRLRCDS